MARKPEPVILHDDGVLVVTYHPFTNDGPARWTFELRGYPTRAMLGGLPMSKLATSLPGTLRVDVRP